MLSRHSSRREVDMGSEGQVSGLELFIIVSNCAIVGG